MRSLRRAWDGTGEKVWSPGLVDQEEKGEEEAAVIPGSWWVVQHLAPLRVGKERSGLQTRSCWLLCERTGNRGGDRRLDYICHCVSGLLGARQRLTCRKRVQRL